LHNNNKNENRRTTKDCHGNSTPIAVTACSTWKKLKNKEIGVKNKKKTRVENQRNMLTSNECPNRFSRLCTGLVFGWIVHGSDGLSMSDDVEAHYTTRCSPV